MHEGIPQERFKKIIDAKIDETPALQASYEQFRGWLENDVNTVSPAEVETARKKAQELSHEKGGEKFFDVERALRFFAEYQSAQNRDAVLERLAKRELYSLGDAELLANAVDDNAAKIVYHLSRAAFNLAQVKFPEDYKRQSKEREEKSEIENRKNELMKKRVS